MAWGRRDLRGRGETFGGGGPVRFPAVAAATASLKHEHLVSDRKKLNAEIRQKTFDWLGSHGYSYVPSQSNCFMLDTKRPAKEVIDAMAARNVYIGRIWPVWPTYTRITIGTQQEMETFQEAFDAVMSNAKTVSFARPSSPASSRGSRFYADGQNWPNA